MSRLGDFYENRITGERVVVLRGDEDAAPGESGFGHLTVAPHGAVAGEHIHTRISERFIVISGTLGTLVGGVERRLNAGEEATAEPGVAHDWWNAGESFASVLVEVGGPDEQRQRFDAMFATIFGLANAGRTNSSGMPSLLQLALIAREFRDVIVFTRPPPAIQTPLFAVLSAVGRLRGLRGVYPEYLHVHGRTLPDPGVLALAGIELPPGQADSP
jgi:mannose-6-phosphate isomerase-like protein (cupin superfamily)